MHTPPKGQASESQDPRLALSRATAGFHDEKEFPVNTQGTQRTSAQDGDAAPEQPASDLDALRTEIDTLDAEILRLVKRRVEVSSAIGAARMAAGGTRIVYNREMDVLARYRELGPEGRQLAMALLNLGRGRLGR